MLDAVTVLRPKLCRYNLSDATPQFRHAVRSDGKEKTQRMKKKKK